jgi:hypothetical protein
MPLLWSYWSRHFRMRVLLNLSKRGDMSRKTKMNNGINFDIYINR